MRVFEGWRFTLTVTAAILAMSVVILIEGGMGEPSILNAIRATARTSAVLFLLAFAAPGFRGRLKPWFRRNSPFLLLAFAGSHLVHFALLVTWVILFPHSLFEELSIPLIAIALVLYGVIVMLARSALRSVKTGSTSVTSMERWGLYLLWAVFTSAFAARALSGPLYPALAVLGIAGLVLRLAGRKSGSTVMGESI